MSGAHISITQLGTSASPPGADTRGLPSDPAQQIRGGFSPIIERARRRSGTLDRIRTRDDQPLPGCSCFCALPRNRTCDAPAGQAPYPEPFAPMRARGVGTGIGGQRTPHRSCATAATAGTSTIFYDFSRGLAPEIPGKVRQVQGCQIAIYLHKLGKNGNSRAIAGTCENAVPNS